MLGGRDTTLLRFTRVALLAATTWLPAPAVADDAAIAEPEGAEPAGSGVPDDADAVPGGAHAADRERPVNPADATRPPEAPRFELALVLENDNKLFGLWQVFATDGNDLGRTHGVLLTTARYLRPTIRLEVDLGSEMFAGQLYAPDGFRLNLRGDGRPYANYFEGRNIYVNELSTLVARVRGLFRRDDRFSWLGGAGIVVSNRRGLSPGATSWQKWFHNFLELFQEDTREYRYLRSGPTRWGVVLEGGVRALGSAFTQPRFRLRGHAETSLVAITLAHGTYARVHGRLALDLGKRRHFDLPLAELAVLQDVRVYPGTFDVMLDTQVDLFFHTRIVDVLVTFDGYYGSPHNAYFDYNFRNTTTTLGLGFRIP